MVFGGKFRIRRCNSKASYLPRQTRDKLNTTDPDHGSYKLTLTSNEDCINQNHHNNGKSFHDDIISLNKCNNLPDVLPVGVKIQNSSPPSTISSPRYGSNNNLSPMTPPNPTTQHCYPSYPNMKLLISKPPVHTQTPISRQNSSPTSPISPSSYSISGSNRSSIYEASSPKFMSQSTIDLKKIHILEGKEELSSSINENILSPAQSENNITTINNNNQNKKALSPFSAKKEFHRTDVVRKLSLEERDPGEGRIVRAELVNTILSSSPITKSDEKITRKDSLRENIEKITQLQSKLMSAHLVENSNERNKIMGLTTKTINVKTLHASIDSEIDKCTENLSKSHSPISVHIPIDNEIENLDATNDNKNESPPPPTSSPPPLSPELPKLSGSDKISQMIPEIDGLKLMQRSELVLRVNPTTMEVASQTDEILNSDMCRLKLIEDSSSVRTTTLMPRAKHPAEIDCDNFIEDLVSHLPLNDKLIQLLVPSIIKTSSDYISGLYNPNVTPRPAKRDVGTSTPVQFDELFDDGCEMNGNAGIMESKMELQITDVDVILVNGGSNSDSCDLTKKKEELVNRLKRKIQVLNHEQTTIGDETSINDDLGCSLLAKVSTKLRSIDATKFRTYIDDVGHITSLLLSLSGRLAKIENLLHSITENNSEKKTLETKRDRLMEQLDEAKRLKEDIDRRGSIVSKTLEQNLNTEEYADYDYFINMKAKFIVDSREITDKIKLSEEQLSALKETLLQSDC